MQSRIEIETSRLVLVGVDGALLRAELAGREALARELDATVPEQWPPEHLDEPSIRWALNLAESLAADAIWRMYYITLPGSTRVAIGTCGYKGPPDANGVAEFGYSLLPAYWNCGYATEAAQALIANAFRQRARTVVAETYPELVASRRVMEKCGMKLAGDGSEAGVIRYAIEGGATAMMS